MNSAPPPPESTRICINSEGKAFLTKCTVYINILEKHSICITDI